MSDGAAILIARHLSRRNAPVVARQVAAALHRVLTEAHARLTSFDPAYAWTSGQWMTERPGGSDVSRTETVAWLASNDDLAADSANYGGQNIDAVDMPLGPYIVDGFKWFSSATDADMVVLLAQSEKGLSAFYAPMKRTSIAANGKKIHVMNGVRISRLKNKLGTKALPTAELEIKGMRAWLLGEEGKGVREISAILNATRLWTAVGATAGWGRGLTISKAYAKVRKIKGEHLLVDNQQHLKWIADETVKYRACVHFAHFGVALLGLSEAEDQAEVGAIRTQAWLPQTQDEASLLLRILTPVMKAQCSLWSTLGLRECMESLGGVGYCENQEDDGVLNLARMFRDSAVNSIWEGTTNILAEDFVRSIKSSLGAQALSVLDNLLESMLEDVDKEFQGGVAVTRQAWTDLKSQVFEKSSSELLYRGRDLLQLVQTVVSACLLMMDANRSRGMSEWLVAQRWISTHLLPKVAWLDSANTKRDIEGDRLIFDGVDRSSSQSSLQSKL